MYNRYFKPAAALILVMTFILGLAFPALVTALGATLFRDQAQGSLLFAGDRLIGSRLVGQHFSDPKYFWGRPSATAPQPYNGAASGGSNLGPSNPALRAGVQARIKQLRDADPAATGAIPIELVSASGSGLDPHISPAAAEFQAARVARVRGLPVATVRALMAEHETPPLFGLLGLPVVNVLELNLALDRLH